MQPLQPLAPRQRTAAAPSPLARPPAAPSQPPPPTAGPAASRRYLRFASLQLLLSFLVLHGLCGEGWGKTEKGSRQEGKVGSDGSATASSAAPGAGPARRSPRPEWNQSPRSLADRPPPHGQGRHRRRHLRLHVNTRQGGSGAEGGRTSVRAAAASGPRRAGAPAAPPRPRQPRSRRAAGRDPAGTWLPRAKSWRGRAPSPGAERSTPGGLAEEVGEGGVPGAPVGPSPPVQGTLVSINFEIFQVTKITDA